MATISLAPQQVLLDSCQSLKLGDFSLACAAGGEGKVEVSAIFEASRRAFEDQKKAATVGVRVPARRLTMPNSPSLFYTAPEVLAGGTQFSFSSDLWSLGCMLFEMCTGVCVCVYVCVCVLVCLCTCVCAHACMCGVCSMSISDVCSSTYVWLCYCVHVIAMNSV